MKASVSFDPNEETIEAKSLWFHSFPVEERMQMLCEFADFALAVNPQLLEIKNAQPTEGPVKIVARE